MMRRRIKINKMITSMNYSKTEKLLKELVEIEHKLLTSYKKNGCTMKMLQSQKLNLTLNISLDMLISIEKGKNPLVH